jgi:hypothetical protein
MADRRIAGAPRFAIRACDLPAAYPRSGNAHNPTPRRYFVLLFDGRPVDRSGSERTLRAAAKAPDAVRRYGTGA